ncbi:uncharacterized protein LOC126969079, partial [Leptidea sinapis]|uniref:uncharacterized protein LOC126969079 n=1 Tax=Leptidea sinapis TaxID=189913 RepID=UPI0021C301D8
SSNWSKNVSSEVPEWDGEAATLCPAETYLPAPGPAGHSISGDVTPVSMNSELDLFSNDATAGSLTDHDLLSADGEEDEETLSAEGCSTPVKIIKNDLGPSASHTLKPDPCLRANVPHLYGLTMQTKHAFYKDLPSSSKNFTTECDSKKCSKDRIQYTSEIDSLNLQGKELQCRSNVLGTPRRYSDSVAQKSVSQTVSGTRFTTTLVREDWVGNSENAAGDDKTDGNTADTPLRTLVTKAQSTNIKPGFNISDP